jgi:hypothetical protein
MCVGGGNQSKLRNTLSRIKEPAPKTTRYALALAFVLLNLGLPMLLAPLIQFHEPHINTLIHSVCSIGVAGAGTLRLKSLGRKAIGLMKPIHE